jgi:hypothetical protein
MDRDKTVGQLASLEVDLINRIWDCVREEEDAFDALSRALVSNPEFADLQNFINHALTGVLLAVAYFRFRETMAPFLDEGQAQTSSACAGLPLKTRPNRLQTKPASQSSLRYLQQ